MKRPVAVLGGGSFGTALAVHLARSGKEVLLWTRSAEQARELTRQRTNTRYLPGIKLPPSLRPTSDLAELAPCPTALVVVPSHGFRQVLRSFLPHSTCRSLTLVSATKGVESDTLARMSEVSFEEGIAANRDVRFAVISGPSFAAELAAGMPTASVVASQDQALAAGLQDQFSARNLRLYSSSDVVGVELGGTAKNVIAIAAGAVSGLGFGHNTVAALITRGLHEITRLGLAWGGQPRTFSGLAGLGDLVLTCTGELSRNRQTGVELARGRSLDEVLAGMSMVAEGVLNSRAILALAQKKGVEMPITEQMVEVLYRGRPPREAVEELMSRELKSEAQL